MGALGGERAASVLLPYMTSDAKWRRKAATFALGEGAPLTPAVVEALCLRIAEDESVYVRAVAAVALGCLYRRSVASTDHQDGKAQLQVRTQPLYRHTRNVEASQCRLFVCKLARVFKGWRQHIHDRSARCAQAQVIDGLLGGLAVEDNRLDQGLRYPSLSKGAQDRAFGLKMWRPCDENDVCEGGAIVSRPDPFKPPPLRDACGLSSRAWCRLVEFQC